jgi:hypothetical protein
VRGPRSARAEPCSPDGRQCHDLIRIPGPGATRVPIAGFTNRDPGTDEVLVTCRGSANLTLNEAVVTVTVADQ